MDAEQLQLKIKELEAALARKDKSLAEQAIALSVKSQEAVELSATITKQQQTIAAKEQQLLELLKALRGKQREHVDPDQLLLFEIAELESIIAEEIEANKPTIPRRRKRKRRLIPDNITAETIDYELP